MSFNKNSASSGSAASNASKASKHSNNKFAPLFKAENQIYNKTSPGPSPFLPKNFVKKAKASHVSGNASAGPSNNTMRRDGTPCCQAGHTLQEEFYFASRSAVQAGY